MSRAEYILEYACGMSFLGNDFLPHSLSVKMREGGHDILRETLAAIHASGLRLVRGDQVQRDGCLDLVRRWAADEERGISEGFEHKYRMRPGPPKSDRERLMLHVENLPIEWAAEEILWRRGHGLADGWQETYRRAWLQEGDVGQICGEYARGLQWILDYYLGSPVSYSWYYPWNLPPLWVDLIREFSGGEAVTAPPSSLPVAPQEQLAMVLPMDSWWLVRNTALRCLPGKAPTFWPRSFGFFSVGRRWLWECEAAVPILTAERLKGM
jgi:5'-3' exonuclease